MEQTALTKPSEIDDCYEAFFSEYDTNILAEKQKIYERILSLEKDICELDRIRREQKTNYLMRKIELLEILRTLQPLSEPESILLRPSTPQEPPKECTPCIKYLYAIQSDLSPTLFRFGCSLDLWGSTPNEKCQVFIVAPTLNYPRDHALVCERFTRSHRSQGWYLLYDWEIQKFFTDFIIKKFNEEFITHNPTAESDSG